MQCIHRVVYCKMHVTRRPYGSGFEVPVGRNAPPHTFSIPLRALADLALEIPKSDLLETLSPPTLFHPPYGFTTLCNFQFPPTSLIAIVSATFQLPSSVDPGSISSLFQTYFILFYLFSYFSAPRKSHGISLHLEAKYKESQPWLMRF